MIETDHGKFELIKDYREALEVKVFNDRYVSYLNRYQYIVGDYSADMLRLKGFTQKNVETIPDYLLESCTPNAPYFVLKREQEVQEEKPKGNKRRKRRKRPQNTNNDKK